MKQLICVGVIALFVCCAKKESESVEAKSTYGNGIRDIIKVSCNNGDCHVGATDGWAVLPDFSNYNNLLPYLDNGKIEMRINTLDSTLSMPPLFREDRTISTLDLEELNDWINNGYPE